MKPHNNVKPIPKSIKGIPDEVFREAKANAARQGKTLGLYVTEALIYLNGQAMVKKPKE